MSDTLYVAWQDGVTRRWHTIAQLRKREHDYEFIFTKGTASLTDLARRLFKMTDGDVYRFDKLIPLFKNKMLPINRADYQKVANWVGITSEDTEFDRLCKFGLIPGTDSILLYPAPDLHQGVYRLKFFIHAIRHMHQDARAWCVRADIGTRLCPLLDVQNEADPNAVALKCADDNILIGYVPAFYAQDFKAILSDAHCAKNARIIVDRNNADAPEQIKLMCEFIAPIPRGFIALDTPSHQLNLKADSQINAYYTNLLCPAEIA